MRAVVLSRTATSTARSEHSDGHVMSRRMMEEIKRLAEFHAGRESPVPAASRGAGHVTISP